MGYKFNPFTGNFDIAAASSAPPGTVQSGSMPATDNSVARFDGATGTVIQDSNAILDDTGNLDLAGSVTATEVIDEGLTANTVIYANGSKQLTSSVVTPTELGYVAGVTSSIQDQLDDIVSGTTPLALIESSIFVGDASDEAAQVDTLGQGDILADATGLNIKSGVIVNADINASAAIDASKIADGSVSSTEFQYLANVTSDIQTQLNGKQTTALTSAHILVGNGSNLATDVAVSGDLTLDNTGNFQIATGVIVNTDINASAAIAFSKLASLTSSHILVGSAGNVATDVAVSGDISIDNTGVTAINSGVIVNADINASAAIDASKIADGSVSSTEFQYINSVTSNVQTQLDNKSTKSAGDINETSFTAADNQSSAADITALVFANGVVRSFEIILSIIRNTTYAQYKLNGIQRAADWAMDQSYVGDITGLVFTITAAGQIQYTSTNTGNTATIKFRAITTSV